MMMTRRKKKIADLGPVLKDQRRLFSKRSFKSKQNYWEREGWIIYKNQE